MAGEAEGNTGTAPTAEDLLPRPEAGSRQPSSGTFAAPDEQTRYIEVPSSDARGARGPVTPTRKEQRAQKRADRPRGRDGVPRGPLRWLYDLRWYALALLLTSPALLWPLAWLIVASLVAAGVTLADGGGFGAVRSFVRVLVSVLVGALFGLVLVAVIAGAIAALLAVGQQGLLVYANAKVEATQWGLRWGAFLGAAWAIRRALGAGAYSRVVLERGRQVAAPIAALVVAGAVVAVALFAQTTTHWATPLAAINPGLQRSVAQQLNKATRLTAKTELGDNFCRSTRTTVTDTGGRLIVTTPGVVYGPELVRLAAVVHNTINPFVGHVLIRTQNGRGLTYDLDRYRIGTRTVATNPGVVAAAMTPVGRSPAAAGVAGAGFGARC